MSNHSVLEQCCTVCDSTLLESMVDFGHHPPSNRFVNSDGIDKKQATFNIQLGFCADCSTIQLVKSIPIEEIKSEYDWLIYNEPESHLDSVVDNVVNLPGVSTDAKILGLTYKDKSTIERFIAKGFNNTLCLSEVDGLSKSMGCLGLETLQRQIRNISVVSQLKETYGTFDIVILRHVIEHAESAREMISTLRDLVSSKGYLILEMPDSQKILELGNHSFIWEEHLSYFTTKSVLQLARKVGASIAWYNKYPYPFEDSLLVALTFSSNPAITIAQDDPGELESRKMLKRFGGNLSISRDLWKKCLAEYLKQSKKIAVFGAGHLAVKFINFLGISEYIDCVIDDNQYKIGMHMPGSLLPIVPSSSLATRDISICISTLSPESEKSVRSKLVDYFQAGGVLISAFKVNGRHNE